MIYFSEIGLHVSLVLLLFLGFAVGVVSGFIGVGGGFLITPALIALGFPGTVAVGTGLATIAGNSIVATARHRQLGNVDVKLAAMMVVGLLAGAEVGVRFVNWLKARGFADEGVLAASLLLTAFIAAFTGWETRRAKRQMDALRSAGLESPREVLTSRSDLQSWMLRVPPIIYLPHSRVRVSLWMLVAIGFVGGTLSGFIGVGGGFVMGPAMIYLVGIPSHISVGTGLLQIIFSAGYGTIRHTMNGNVLIFASFLILLGGSLGTQIGALATRYVSGPAVRLVLALAVGIAAIGTAFQLASVLFDPAAGLLERFAQASLFGGLGVLMLSIIGLLALGLTRQRGGTVPDWALSLVVGR
jgi:uncharacterized membrane protein YfcA